VVLPTMEVHLRATVDSLRASETESVGIVAGTFAESYSEGWLATRSSLSVQASEEWWTAGGSNS
jgi:hypothetical protein